jgi:hypothetical protein
MGPSDLSRLVRRSAGLLRSTSYGGMTKAEGIKGLSVAINSVSGVANRGALVVVFVLERVSTLMRRICSQHLDGSRFVT